MIRRVLVNGRPVLVEAGPGGTVRVDDRERSVSIVEAESGVWSVLLDGRSFEVTASSGSCTVDGDTFVVEIEDPRALKRTTTGAAAGGRQTLTAAMPGKVVRVLVSPGEQVEAEQGIAVVEAMKMQNEVKALRSGRVVSVPVSAGSAVATGEVLAIIE